MSLAIYANVTGLSGAVARHVKASIRNRIASFGGVVTSIYRNPRVQGHPYRFIRVHYETRNRP